MEENKSETNPVVANNKRVFRNGALIGVLGGLLTFCSLTYWIIKDSNQILVGYIALMALGGFILALGIIQWIFYKIFFSTPNKRNLEISDEKKRTFYALELLVAISPIFIAALLLYSPPPRAVTLTPQPNAP